MPEQLTRKQVELILRRATDLEQRNENALEVLTPQDLERVADELGMSRDSLNQALAESRAGVLVSEEERTVLDRFFGRRIIEARRFVPGDAASVRLAVDQFLDDQGFQLKRNLGEAQVWEAGRGWWTRVRRAMQARTYRLPRDIEIEVRVTDVPGGPHPVLVVLRVDATRSRSSHLGAAAVSLAAGALVVGGGALLLPMPLELLAIGGGGLAGLGGTWLSRSTFREERERLTVAVERFLDFLEHESRPVNEPARDPLKRLGDFLSREWWR